jgi:glutamate synthase (NADPH/NADH) small chain
MAARDGATTLPCVSALVHPTTGAPFEELRPPLTADEAVVEADRCLACGAAHAPAPCVIACPAGVDIPAFVAAIADGDPRRGASIVFEENLLGASCARVCPVEVLCEGACVLAHVGRKPIAVAALQRHATDVALAEELPLRPSVEPTGRRVAVIGAGPAGLACAGELAARGNEVTVYDERDEVGGLVRYAIAPYRIGREPLPAEARALERLGVRIELDHPVRDRASFDAIAADADAVFLGVGMGADAELDLPGSDLSGVWDSLPFIEALKNGHAPEVGERVVVLGGGNTAVDVAREAVRLGADVVTLAYRRTPLEMPAYAHEVVEARDEGVQFEWLAEPVRFVGRGRLVGVVCQMMRLGEPDASGRRRPAPIEGTEFTIPADTAVRAVGQRPRSEIDALVDGVELDGGRIVVDDHGRTTNPKIFAGGDAVNGGKSAVQSVADGKRAARAIDEWLRCAS